MLEHSGMKGRDEVERRKAEEEKVRVGEEERKRTDAVRRIVEAERKRREEQERLRIESLLRRDVVQTEINYMSGADSRSS